MGALGWALGVGSSWGKMGRELGASPIVRCLCT